MIFDDIQTMPYMGKARLKPEGFPAPSLGEDYGDLTPAFLVIKKHMVLTGIDNDLARRILESALLEIDEWKQRR